LGRAFIGARGGSISTSQLVDEPLSAFAYRRREDPTSFDVPRGVNTPVMAAAEKMITAIRNNPATTFFV